MLYALVSRKVQKLMVRKKYNLKSYEDKSD